MFFRDDSYIRRIVLKIEKRVSQLVLLTEAKTHIYQTKSQSEHVDISLS